MLLPLSQSLTGIREIDTCARFVGVARMLCVGMHSIYLYLSLPLSGCVLTVYQVHSGGVKGEGGE